MIFFLEFAVYKALSHKWLIDFGKTESRHDHGRVWIWLFEFIFN